MAAAISCQELVELVTDYLEGTLSRRVRRRVEAHLAACDGCDVYVDQMRGTLVLLGSVPVDTIDEQARGTLMKAFRDFHG